MRNNGCEYCGRPTRRRRLCEAHYYRLRRTGELGPKEVWNRVRKPCSVEGCDRLAKSNSYCDKHFQRWSVYGTTDLVGLPERERHWNWSDNPSYDAVHQRLRKWRGKASEHRCVRCGQQARQWAVDHALADREDPYGHPYTADLDAYSPMCVPCHKRMDLGLA